MQLHELTLTENIGLDLFASPGFKKSMAMPSLSVQVSPVLTHSVLLSDAKGHQKAAVKGQI